MVARNLAERLVAENSRVRGEGVGNSFCGNLIAHLAQEMKKLFGNSKVLLFYSPPQRDKLCSTC